MQISEQAITETAIQLAWEGSPKAWARKAAKSNEWRVLPALDCEDLFQEAWILWYKVCNAYPDATPPNRMSLFTVSVLRRFHSLASSRTRKLPRGCALVGGDVDQVMDAQFDGFEAIDADDFFDSCSQYIRRLLAAFSGERRPGFLRRGQIRETTPEYLRRLSGAPQDLDMLGVLTDWRESLVA
jgi:hypothetical protein